MGTKVMVNGLSSNYFDDYVAYLNYFEVRGKIQNQTESKLVHPFTDNTLCSFPMIHVDLILN